MVDRVGRGLVLGGRRSGLMLGIVASVCILGGWRSIPLELDYRRLSRRMCWALLVLRVFEGLGAGSVSSSCMMRVRIWEAGMEPCRRKEACCLRAADPVGKVVDLGLR